MSEEYKKQQAESFLLDMIVSLFLMASVYGVAHDLLLSFSIAQAWMYTNINIRRCWLEQSPVTKEPK